MRAENRPFDLRLARSEADLIACQRLRYEVFVAELGGTGAMIDHAARLERDRFDAHFDHLMLEDRARAPGDRLVGAYRLMREDQAAAAGQFYSDDEYDLAPLHATGRPLLELGRSCVHADYRDGTALMHLWNGVAAYVDRHGIGILFGVASFHGTDVGPLAAPLSLLHHRHLAPRHLRVRSRHFQPMDLIDPATLDRPAAIRAVPSLVKAYLRLGGVVGEGAFVDHAFNTTDICIVIDMANVSARRAALYRPGPA